MLGQFLTGARYLLTGCRLLSTPGVRRFVIVPLLISAVLFTGGIWYSGHVLELLIERMTPAWLDWMRYLLWPIFALVALVLVYFGFTVIANVFGAPFNGWLADAIEHALTGARPVTTIGWRRLPAEIGATILSELRKMAFFGLWSLPFLLLLFVPLAGPILWFLFSAWVFACNYADYPMGNHGLKFQEQRRLLASQRSLILGFGVATLLLTLIPLVNFIAMPAAVAGATAMYLEHFAADRSSATMRRTGPAADSSHG